MQTPTTNLLSTNPKLFQKSSKVVLLIRETKKKSKNSNYFKDNREKKKKDIHNYTLLDNHIIINQILCLIHYLFLAQDLE